MKDNEHKAMRAISKMIQQNISFPESIRTDFAIADTTDDALDRITALSKKIACDDCSEIMKKAWLAHLQFVLSGVNAFAEGNGIDTSEEVDE